MQTGLKEQRSVCVALGIRVGAFGALHKTAARCAPCRSGLNVYAVVSQLGDFQKLTHVERFEPCVALGIDEVAGTRHPLGKVLGADAVLGCQPATDSKIERGAV